MTNYQRRMLFLFFGAILCAALLGMCASAHATTVTGLIKWQGQPLNGYVDVALVYPGTTGSALILPGSDPNGHRPIYNGNFPVTTLDGNDTLQPSGTYYQITYYSQYAAPIAVLNYVITGSTFNIGSAVATPITPANISFLDLLGLRNVSVANLTVTNQIQIGSGTILSVNGLSNAKMVNGIAFAAPYAGASTTCGIQEAMAALPATGGTVWLQSGLCIATTGITITKPVIIRGMGRGGTPPINGALTSPTVLANGSTSANLFTVSPPSSTVPLAGVTFQDFAILGNLGVAGASAGDCINLTDTFAAKLSAVDVESMFVYGCKGSGLTVNGSGVGTVTVKGSSLSANGVNGLQVLSGATAASVAVERSTFTLNVNAGLMFADGTGHTVSDSQITPGATQQYGVYANLPTNSDSSAVQLTLRGNNLQGNLTYDLYQAATVSYLLLYPQAELQTGSTVHYNLLNPSTVHQIQPIVARTCGSNGCYRVEADGTIEEWGTVFCSGITCPTITFPIAFTTTANLSFTASPSWTANNLTTGWSSLSTTSVVVVNNGVVCVGGGCPSYSGGATNAWHAIGN